MENFFNWISKPIPKEDIDVWFRINNIVNEKSDLFFDFCYSLYTLMVNTYLGEEESEFETKVEMSDSDKSNHFNWCWKKTISNFQKENLDFIEDGEQYTYFQNFFMEVFYNQKDEMIRKQIGQFFIDLFDKEKTFTKSDLDLYTEMYKLLDKQLVK